MTLTRSQIEFYQENGFLILEGLFSQNEMNELNAATNSFDALQDLPNIIREDDGSIRSVFAPHKLENAFDRLYRENRIVEPCSQLIDSDIYLYQFKLNNKKKLSSECWEWHQDFPYWHIDDQVPEPKMISAMVLLQDTHLLQGPLIMIPGSHKEGIVDFQPKEHHLAQNTDLKQLDIINSLSADLKYTIDKQLLESLLTREEPVVCQGKAGTCVLFHPNIFHASGANMLPFDRNTAILTYNDINNLPMETENRRPDYICSRDYDAIHYLTN